MGDERRLGDLAARVQVSVGNLDDPASLRPALRDSLIIAQP